MLKSPEAVSDTRIQFNRIRQEILVLLTQKFGPNHKPDEKSLADLRLLQAQYIEMHKQIYGNGPEILPLRDRAKFLRKFQNSNGL
jgi:hypothetical protein